MAATTTTAQVAELESLIEADAGHALFYAEKAANGGLGFAGWSPRKCKDVVVKCAARIEVRLQLLADLQAPA